MATGQVQVLRDFGPQAGGWLQCADAQGTFFFNKVTQQSSDTAPPELAALLGLGGMCNQQQPVQSAPQASAPKPEVLRELGGGWLQCKDHQGIFYYNSLTQESRTDPPPGIGAPTGPQVQYHAGPSQQVASQPQVLREFPGGWLQCQDAQGVFYQNTMTKQTVDQPPPQIAHLVASFSQVQQVSMPQQQHQQLPPQAVPQAAQVQAQVLREFPGNWLQCKDGQGVFYQNSVTKQTLDNPPPEIAAHVAYLGNGAGGPAAPQPQPHYAPATAQPSMAAQAPSGQATLKGQIGVWQILEDAQGEFYCHSVTKQTYDQPPPELLQLVQQQN